MTAPSTNSNRLSNILITHNYEDSAMDECIALLGESKRQRVQEMLSAAQAVKRADGGIFNVATPRDAQSHNIYTNAYNDLCGYPDQTLVAMQQMLSSGHPLAVIADHYGWSEKRVARFLNGDRAAYFAHGK